MEIWFICRGGNKVKKRWKYQMRWIRKNGNKLWFDGKGASKWQSAHQYTSRQQLKNSQSIALRNGSSLTSCGHLPGDINNLKLSPTYVTASFYSTPPGYLSTNMDQWERERLAWAFQQTLFHPSTLTNVFQSATYYKRHWHFASLLIRRPCFDLYRCFFLPQHPTYL